MRSGVALMNILMPSSLGSVSKLCEITLSTCTTCYGELHY